MLSLRLKTIASFLNKNDNVIDIGCDHGYLSIYLKKTVGCLHVLATDINQNALNNAINNIKKQKLADQIKTILSDGLKNIDVKDYNTIVISGMGTSTILDILSDEDKLKNINKLIIQSNNDYYELRKEITKKDYYINNEKIVYDKEKYYLIIEFKKGKQKYKKEELYYGPIASKNKENKAYFEFLLQKNLEILKNVPQNKINLRKDLEKHIKIINKILKFN